MKPKRRLRPQLWWLLEEYCRDNGIDVQELDSSLGFGENMEQLARKFGTLKTPTIYERIRRKVQT